MKSSLPTLGRTLLTSALALTTAVAAGCATEEEMDECQPGDIDCSTDAPSDGKADAWDYTNDPARLANNLKYKLADLPRTGKLDKPVWKSRFPNAPATMNPIWTETYLPSAEGSTNNRWQGASVKSPLEKYDQAFNNTPGAARQPSRRCGPQAKAEWDAYLAEAGPAAKWHSQNFQYMSNGYNGRDDDSNGQTDECSGGQDGWGPDRTPAGWWGLCHAWTPASILEPEAINPVTVNGVTFDRSDIHALIMTVYDRNEALMLGGRCNADEFTPDNINRGANEECNDTNPGAMHVVLANFLGIADQAIAFDRTAGAEVWNQPIYSYEVTQQDEVTAAKANECVGASGSTWSFNSRARKLYEVRSNVEYVVEGGASKRVLAMTDYLSSDSYHYILEVGTYGKVIGGRWCSDSADSHPDFMWAPKKAATSNTGRNPGVSLEKVRELLNKSVNGDTGGGGGGGTPGTDFAAAPNAAIPDNNPTGVSSDLAVTGATGTGGGSVSVNIKHTWRGDLVVKLLRDGREIKTLHNAEGGSAQDLVNTYSLSATELGSSRNGTYTLKVVDTAAQDTGTLLDWKLSL